MPIENVLIIDDEPLICKFLQDVFLRKKLNVDVSESGKKALSLLKASSYDLVITDMSLGDMTGLDILTKIKESSPTTLVIVMTAFGTIENAIEAIKKGAFHYILKPFTLDVLEITLAKVNEHQSLLQENIFLRKEVTKEGDFNKIVALSPVMQKILEDVSKVAISDASILVHGESGTGKELIAGAIHRLSHRSSAPYVKVNCAAIAETLLESEFFGHEKGSFTGAISRRMGRFELADKGTLFLDEVTEIPITLQPKLLRAIQELEFERVGGSKPISVDVRIISSSNRDLKQAIQDKIFREDLFYRLNVIPLHLPPLRDRKEDILPLTHYFLEKFCIENHKKKKKLSESGAKKLQNYPWPGNIRELANVIERAVVLENGSEINIDFL